MKTIGMAKAQASFSSLVAKLERGEMDGVVITRSGKPVAMMLPTGRAPERIGIAKGAFVAPDCLDAQDEEIVSMFNGQ